MRKHQLKYVFLVFLGTGLLTSVAPAQSLGRAPSTSDHPATKRQQGFTDYALGKINSDNHDYGSGLESARGGLVINTVDDLYFWSNCVTMGLLVAVTGCYLLQLRSSDKKEQIAATLIAQMWNGRVSDKIEIDKRTATYNALVDQQNEMVEKTLGDKPGSRPKRAADSTNDQAGSNGPGPRAKGEKAPADAPAKIGAPLSAAIAERKEDVPDEQVTPAIEAVDRNDAEKSAHPRIDEIGSDPLALKQEVIRLRAQVGAFKNRENNLLVRLNAAEEYKKQQEGNTVSR
jgi:hypothetical protein